MKNKEFRVDFIGIGSAKCATSWAFRCLREHPEICGPRKKELNFFLTKNPGFGNVNPEHHEYIYNKGPNFYAKYFSDCKDGQKRGEYSVAYMNDEGAARRIRECFPEVKIIVMLRDPVKRAFSLYWFAKEFLRWEKNGTFEDAIKRNKEAYVDNGMYYKRLKAYFDLFPRENIGVFFVDDLKKDPVKFMQKMYKFLEVSSEFIPPSALKRENAAKKTKIKILKKATDRESRSAP